MGLKGGAGGNVKFMRIWQLSCLCYLLLGLLSNTPSKQLQKCCSQCIGNGFDRKVSAELKNYLTHYLGICILQIKA